MKIPDLALLSVGYEVLMVSDAEVYIRVCYFDLKTFPLTLKLDH